MSRGTIILVNGTTSAGKSTIAKALQEVMDEPYFLSGPDHFQLSYPPGYLTITDDPEITGDGVVAVYGVEGLQDVRFGPLARQVFAGVFGAMAALSDAGLNVIIDSALSEQWNLETAVSILHPYPAYFICIDISRATAETREQDRGDRGPGNVRYFYDRVYGLNDVYDLRVDAGENDPRTCAVTIKETVTTTEPTALERLYREFN
ncbi:hypothetical protein BH23CHL2_BH23CHL2_06780 [soil metagenome]